MKRSTMTPTMPTKSGAITSIDTQKLMPALVETTTA